ncbi:MAG: hypothetical protein HY291_21885 [Planctomycetes bacterium]|nr:hypothetical protein [Planctomycetota bacterium]
MNSAHGLRASRVRALRRARLAREIFELAFAETASFAEDEIGVDLAYLLGAILEPSGRGRVDWTVENRSRAPALWGILKRRLSVKHAVWKHISKESSPK